MIGPEGGFSSEEIDAVRKKMQVLSLGRRILRTDTAAITMMSALMLHLETMEQMEQLKQMKSMEQSGQTDGASGV